ncbi:hypothetical protein [Flavobacterium sp. LC2016-23]|uniref:hypothetical protein n=1 Tax=Flavobacterium sp. LC2016-23 TaxID=2666330 RepID=UPI001E30C182|nr:hypothetical protein [Flavobacterium sp. LC2016-23]
MMETKEIKKLENLKELIASYLNTSKSINDKSCTYKAQIKMLNYHELGFAITNMLKMCVLALNQEVHTTPETDPNQFIDVVIILEMVLEMFPLDEFEMLSEINKMLIEDFQDV